MGEKILVCKCNLHFSPPINSTDMERLQDLPNDVFTSDGAALYVDEYNWISYNKVVKSLDVIADYMKHDADIRTRISGELLGFIGDGGDSEPRRLYVRNGRVIEDDVPIHWRQYYPRY